MLSLPNTVSAWGTMNFKSVLKNELESCDVEQLALQDALKFSSSVSGNSFQVMVNHISDEHDYIYVRVGVFYQGVVSGCNCSDDPSPVTENEEYCELALRIKKSDGKTQAEFAGE